MQNKIQGEEDTKIQPHFIDDIDQVIYLVTPKTQKYFMPFLGRPRSSSQAARETKTSLQNMYYHIQKMLRLGLIQETENRRYVSLWESYSFVYGKEANIGREESVKLQIVCQLNEMEEGLVNLSKKKHKNIHFLYRDQHQQVILSNKAPNDYRRSCASADGFAKGGSIVLDHYSAQEFEVRVEQLVWEFEQRSLEMKMGYNTTKYLYSLIFVKEDPK